MHMEHWHADQCMESHVLKELLHVILIMEGYRPYITFLLFVKQSQLSCFPKAKVRF